MFVENYFFLYGNDANLGTAYRVAKFDALQTN